MRRRDGDERPKVVPLVPTLDLEIDVDALRAQIEGEDASAATVAAVSEAIDQANALRDAAAELARKLARVREVLAGTTSPPRDENRRRRR